MEILIFNAPSMGTGIGGLLVRLIAWLIQICSSIALGVILFTVLLKLITLPFDFISRASMRKNSLKMEEMRPELEKLQKQYAHDKDLYNQKMAALYKRNGYSMWGSCLPTIITLIIFIVAINAFTNYSKFANQTYIYNMTNSYNNVVYSGFDIDGNYIKRDANGKLIINSTAIEGVNDNAEIDKASDDPDRVEIKVNDSVNIYYEVVYKDVEGVSTPDGFKVYTTNSIFVYYNTSAYNGEYKIEDYSKLENGKLGSAENNYWINSAGKNFAQAFDLYKADKDFTVKTEEEYKAEYAIAFIKDIRETKSAESFRKEDTRFLWVKNVWVTDSPMKSPIESDWKSYKASFIGDDASVKLQEDQYNSLIAKLDKEKTQANGYFVLVALTALSSFLTQFVTSKSQKAQMELQTVDGQGAQTNKMMMWMMPIMMAVFSFMYTAAFSIYIILSSVISLGSTLLINFIIDRKYQKVVSESKPAVVRGRVYTPPKQEETKPEKKSWFAKKPEPEKPDFLTYNGKKKGK